MKMPKNLDVTMLLDFYGEMLTDKQKDMIELYYNEDLSLGEIAETAHITRQGVRDSIKRGEQQLFDLESKLGLVKKFRQYNEILEKINELAGAINDESTTYNYSRNISTRAKMIMECVEQSKEII